MMELIIAMGLWGGCLVVGQGLGRSLSELCGCMEHSYDVTLYDEERHEMAWRRITARQPVTLHDDAQGLGIWLARQHPALKTFWVVAIVPVSSRSVLWKKLTSPIRKAFTRTADDAVREWKQHGEAA